MMGAKITLEQRAKIDAVALEMREEAHRTTPIDREECQKAIHSAYDFLKLSRPTIEFVQSPIAAFRELKRRTGEVVPDVAPSTQAVLTSIGLPDEILAMMMSAPN